MSEQKICLNCRTLLDGSAVFCKVCRGRRFESVINCKYCGEAIVGKLPKFCPKCGQRLVNSNSANLRRIYSPDGVIHDCSICQSKVEFDVVFCPSCTNAFHAHHLFNWIAKHETCPVCRVTLKFVK